MENATVDAATIADAAQHSLSAWSLFLQADIVVKLVLLLLLAASFWSWAIIFDKVIRMRRLRREADRFEDAFWSGGSLDALYDRVGDEPSDPFAAVFASAMREWRRFTRRGGQ